MQIIKKNINFNHQKFVLSLVIIMRSIIIWFFCILIPKQFNILFLYFIFTTFIIISSKYQEMENQDYNRLKSLFSQRLMQIKRLGIFVRLHHSHQILPAYLQCNFYDAEKLQTLLLPKTALQLCHIDGQPILTIPKRKYFTTKKCNSDLVRVYLQDKYQYRHLNQNVGYILVYNNATIGVLSTILQRRLQGQRYFHKIQDFMQNTNCKQIPMEEQYQFQHSYQNDLNKQQNEAIQKALKNHLTFIKGPPGCGKTRTISRMVRMFAERGLKIIVGSISNIANQTLINQIIKQVDQHNYICDYYPQYELKKIRILINYSRMSMQKLNHQLKRYSINTQLVEFIWNINTSSSYNQDNIGRYIESLQKGETVPDSFYKIYQTALTKLISEINVVITTTVNSFKIYTYTQFRPEVGIIDQAAQASIMDTYGFLTFGITRMIFVGDQKQLLPVVIGDSTKNKILQETMFQKLAHKNQQYFVHLKTQYRMHPQISQFPNIYIYHNMLQNSQTVLKQRQSSIQYFKWFPISFIQHKCSQYKYVASTTLDLKQGAPQFYNLQQGSLIMQFLQSIPMEQIKHVAIITFYDMQYQVLSDNFKKYIEEYGLTIKTIDGYQGGEKDYIIISTVRSNPEYNSGFCKAENRVNVALTRAKKGLIIFGDPQTLMQGKNAQDQQQNIWGKFYKHLLRKNRVANHQQFLNILETIKLTKNEPANYVQNTKYNEIDIQKTLSQIISIITHTKIQDDQQIIQKNKKQRKFCKRILNEIRNTKQLCEKINLRENVVKFFNQRQNSKLQNTQVNGLVGDNLIDSEKIKQMVEYRYSKLIQIKMTGLLNDILENFMKYKCQQENQQPKREQISYFNNLVQQEIQNLIEQCQKYLLKFKQISQINTLEQHQSITFLIQSKIRYITLQMLIFK